MHLLGAWKAGNRHTYARTEVAHPYTLEHGKMRSPFSRTTFGPGPHEFERAGTDCPSMRVRKRKKKKRGMCWSVHGWLLG